MCCVCVARSCICVAELVIQMQAEINYIVNNPVERKGDRVLVRYAGTENTISKSEVAGKVSDEQVKLFRLCGLDDSDIKSVVKFLRS